jgi:hypothetical protein
MRKPIVTALLLAALLAGCGNSAPSLGAFKSGFSANKKSFHTLGVDLQQAIATAQHKTDAQLATEIGALATRARQQAASLGKLNPPSRYKRDLNKLVTGFKGVSSDLSRIATAATRHDNTAARSATVALVHDASSVKTADTAISAGLHLPTTG